MLQLIKNVFKKEKISGIKNVLTQKYDVFFLIFAICISVVFRFLCRDFESEDYTMFLREWINFYKENGGFFALKDFEGDYNVLYQYILIIISYFKIESLYLIKLVSCIFDVILAYGCSKYLGILGDNNKKQRICFSVMILLPTVILNSSMWGQCDSIYACCIIWSLYYLAKKRNAISIALLTLAFLFKLQTIFIMPVFLICFLKKEIKVKELFVFPLVYIIAFIPAFIFGKPLSAMIEAYVTQVTEYPLMVMNAPSVFSLIGLYDYNAVWEKNFIALTGIYVLAIVFSALKTSKNNILHIALLCVVGVPFLLPHMHERYFYLSVIFAVLCVFAYGKRFIWIAVSVEVSSLICYLHYFDFINKYSDKILSYLLSSYTSVLLMALALVLTIVFVFVKSLYNKPAIIYSVALTTVLSFVIFINTHFFVCTKDRMINFRSGNAYIADDGKAMIPLRDFASSVGGNVYYNKQVQKITVDYGKNTIFLAFDSDVAEMNGQQITIDEIVLKERCTYVSHSDIEKMFNMTCVRNNKNKITFYKN